MRSSQAIPVKAELRVGYSLEYASKYSLPFLKEIIDVDPERHSDGLASNVFKKRRGKMHHCPVCVKSFFKVDSLKRHLNIHDGNPVVEKFLAELEANSRARRTRKIQRVRKTKPKSHHQFKCTSCIKVFQNAERLKKHLLVHNPNVPKPFKCDYCVKRFLNASAQIAHVKTHILGRQHYTCLVCEVRFTQIVEFSRHIKTHSAEDGLYPCLYCDKRFSEYILMRKHVLTLHRPKRFRCEVCDKMFYSLSKMRLHQLRHTKKKEFLCAVCGRQYKRKDKLTEHLKTHDKKMEETIASEALLSELPASSNQEYQRFIYKCHECTLGFKRRGMLVNHLAKRHPDIQIESVPELNLPILQEQKFFYCQYCPKVYRTNAKRKLHILKYHPGKELPKGGRQNVSNCNDVSASSFTETVATITTEPHFCNWCHRQYASRTKLATHKRKKHPEKITDQMIVHYGSVDDDYDDNIHHDGADVNRKSYVTDLNGRHAAGSCDDYNTDKYHPNGMDYEINSISHFSGEVYEPHDGTEMLVETIETSEISNLMDEIDYMNPCSVAIVTNTNDSPSTIECGGSGETLVTDFKDLKAQKGRRKRNY